jgi:uncharacterized protein involved in exopolysaccharide biosynthesis
MTDSEPSRFSGGFGDQFRLIDILRILARRRLIIVGMTLIAGLLALAIVLMLPKQYRATASLMVAPPKLGEAAQVAPTPMGTYRALLQDPSLSKQVLTDLGLDKPPHNLSADTFAADNVEIEDVPATALLRVHVEMRDPQLAAQVANRLATGVADLNQRLSQQEAVYAGDRIRDQLVQARAKLDEAERRLLEFRSSAQLDLRRKDVDALLDQRGDLLSLSVDIAAERARAARAEYELSRQKPVLDVPRVSTDTGPLLQSSIEQAAKAAAADNKLSVHQSDEGDAPTPSRAPTESRSNRSMPPDMQSRVVNPVYEALEYQAAASRSRLAALETQRTELIGRRKLNSAQLAQLTALYERESEEARRELELDLTRKNYVDLSTRYDQARVQIANRTSQLQVVGNAVAPTRPSSPRVVLTVAGVVILAFIASLFLVFALEYLAISRAADARTAARLV